MASINLFAISIFLASAQLFLVQPMFAKRLLPILGGTPAVWNTCMLFYQTLLLAGYCYAHLLTSRWSCRRQLTVHAGLVLLPLLVLFNGAPAWPPPDVDHAVPWLLSYLLAAVGLPFFVLSTNAPLVQRWYALSIGGSGKNAYFLYSASNLGSMVALIAYPALIEPHLRLHQQYTLIVVTYVAFVIVMAAIIARCWNIDKNQAPISSSEDSSEGSRNEVIDKGSSGSRTVSSAAGKSAPATARNHSGTVSATGSADLWKERAYFVFLAFIPSSLLLSVTTYVTSNIAPVPLFWVIPLALYLLTFIIAFAPKQMIDRHWLFQLQAILLVSLCTIFFWSQIEFAFSILFPLHLVTFFVVALVCHTELAARRPDAARLTEFYLCVAIGGALGGTFNALIAPVIFRTTVEYPAVLALSCLARPQQNLFGKQMGWRFGSLMLCLCLASIAMVYAASENWNSSWMDYRVVAVLAPAAVFCLLSSVRPAFMMLCLSTILLVGANIWTPEVLFQGRNLFGTLTVLNRTDGTHYLTHGNIVHGIEQMKAERPREPLSYFHYGGPVGHIFSAYASRWSNCNIGVVGLGAGSMAAYAQPGQHWTFYEINPMVVKVAQDDRLFTYMKDCRAATVRVVLGDGRQSLNMAPDKSFALIAFDAFNSDAIPIHLLTKESLQLYIRKLMDGGILAFHISSRAVDLKPPLRELARDANLTCLVEESGQSPNFHTDHKLVSTWCVMARSSQDLEPLESTSNFRPPKSEPKASLWTDDFSDLIETLRLN